MIVQWDDRYKMGTIELWNTVAVKDGYKEMTEESFDRIIAGNPHFDPACTFIWMEEGAVTGFACGCTGDELPLGERAGYITAIILKEDAGTVRDIRFGLLLDALESRFRELGKTQSDVLFFNPMQLPWYIPGTDRHEHNNAPGVPAGSALHHFLLGRGYAERAVQCAMYLPLGDFKVPESVVEKERVGAEQGYTVGLLGSAEPAVVRKSAGAEEQAELELDALLEALDNPLWKREVSAAAEAGVPVVIAAFRGKSVGFAGPVIRQLSGRGYFAGIGVHPAHEGHGLGSSLFFRLCEAFQSIGTDYMSLYTGSENPAKRIYEKAGFRTVKTFATMRRELSSHE
ncbi:GNAT family N-acetyltransferase [Paenibacillus sp. GCM10027627]|uniref:GNAT family N-acetyltransferase n=1 Tax=unclassified Paenibacillus TaxID=185978 RepID=UPI003637FBE9